MGRAGSARHVAYRSSDRRAAAAPAEFGERRFLTDEELAAREQQYTGIQGAYKQEIDTNKMGMGHWVEWGKANRLTSLIIDPPNGQLPALTAEGERRRALMRSGWMSIPFDHWTDFDNWDRCITRGLPASMLPAYYNNGVEILQSPGYVVIRLEMIHEARVIPITSEPVDSDAKAWFGYSRGRWEGNTLVVETTNFNGQGSSTNIHTVGSPPFNNTPISEEYVLTERFTRTGPDAITYQATLNDPVIWTAPWTVELPWQRDDSYEIFEYACHEDNSMIRNYIVTSRHERANNPGSRTIMKSLIAVGTLAALAAFSSGAQPQRPQNQGGAPADPGAGFGPQQLTTFKVRDNFYMIRSGQSGNCSVLIADDGVVLIDNKFEMDHDGIMTKLREITDKPVLYVINTHLHARSLGRQRDEAGIGRQGHRTRERALPDGQDADYGPAEPHARRAHAPVSRRVRARPLLARARPHGRRHRDSPARAEDDLHGRPVRDLGSLRDLIHYAAGGSLREWSRTLERALALPFDTVIPGHGGATDRAHLETYRAQPCACKTWFAR